MTGNSEEIKNLRYKQARRKKKITRYKKRAKKHIFLLTIPFLAYIAINLDDAFQDFGGITNFIGVVFSVMIVFILIYMLFTYYLIKQQKREIKVIRSKLYKLMKLNDE